MRPFQQKIWMLSFVFWVGVLSWPVGLYRIMQGDVSAWWLLGPLVGYYLVAVALSVGYHRLFAHRTYKTSKFWHVVFGFVGTIAWHGSPLQWVALHTTHHKHPDDDKDPHYTGWSYLFHKRYRPVKLDLYRTRKLLRGELAGFHKFIHEYYVLICLGFMWMLYLISPNLALFYYLMPMGVVGLVGGIHQVTAHGFPKSNNNYARNYPILEYILPSMGEWMHANHHKNWTSADFRSEWWHLDTGYLIVKLIRNT